MNTKNDSVLKRTAKWSHGVTKVVATTIAIVSLALFAGCLQSIRPDLVSRANESTRLELETKGRRLLRESAERHGLERWKSSESISFKMKDVWQGVMGGAFNPWPENPGHVEVHYRLNSFDGRVTFIDGALTGTSWGIQSFKTYEQPPGGSPVFKNLPDVAFSLPAYQYLLEFPFRALAAPEIVYAGPEFINKVQYDRVFVSWKNEKQDEFMAYIHPETGLIDRLQYTVRAVAPFIIAAIQYSDFHTIDGLRIPLVMTATDGPGDDPKGYLHEMRLERDSVQLNPVPEEFFIVDPRLPTLGDEKPAS